MLAGIAFPGKTAFLLNGFFTATGLPSVSVDRVKLPSRSSKDGTFMSRLSPSTCRNPS